MKKILIIGKNGFVGKSLTEYFNAQPDYEVTATSSRELDLMDGEAVREALSKVHYDLVIDAACFVPKPGISREEQRALNHDLRMYQNLARCSQLFGRMIIFGSGAEYDKRGEIVSVTEKDLYTHPLPDNDYGFSKYLIARDVETTENIYDLRIFGLYGRYEDYRVKFITGCIGKAIFDIPLSIRKNVYFDFLYIDDFCRMLHRFAELDKPAHHVYNIVKNEKVDLLTLAKLVLKVTGKTLPVTVAQEGLANEYTACGERLQDEIGYHDFVTHEDAIREIYEYYLSVKDKLDEAAIRGNI